MPEQHSSTEQKVEHSRKKINRHALIVGFFTLMSRVLGAVREIVLLHVFGAGAVLDAFIMSFTIPNLFRRLTAEGALSAVFVPLYVDIKHNKNPASARLFAQKVMALTTVLTSVLVGLGLLFTPELVTVFASGFMDAPEKFDLTVQLTKVMFAYLIFISLTALAMGILNSEDRFAAPAFAPVLLNACMIGAAVLLSPFFEQPIFALAWGVMAGGVVQLVLQVPFLLAVKQPLAPKAFWQDEDIKRLLRLMLPTLFGVAVYQINIIVLRNIGSYLPDGQLTYYNAASRLQELVVGVFAFSYASASLPEFSLHTSKAQWQAVYQSLKHTIDGTFFFLLPATAGLVAFATPVVAMLYLHGAFHWQDVVMTAGALQIIALGIPAASLVRVLVAIFFAMKDTRSPVLASVVSLLSTVLLGPGLSEVYWVNGLVLTLTISMWVQVLVLLFLLFKKSDVPHGWFPQKTVLQYFVLSLCMGAVIAMTSPLFHWQQGPGSVMNWLVFIGIIALAVTFYFTVLVFLGNKNAREMSRWLGNKLRLC